MISDLECGEYVAAFKEEKIAGSGCAAAFVLAFVIYTMARLLECADMSALWNVT
jgi:hypothetical protein